ncbi:hypothetical protein [Streptomyces sp. NPDC002564]|uniref:hypothetical protein n=1 Tax=Streptomyces sp. NPDC002564 TaxID=3364649 RepID=UPI0036A7BE72
MAKRAVRRTTPRGGAVPTIRASFFAAFSATMEAVGVPHKVIARETRLGLSTISCYKSERVPEGPGPLELIYKVLEKEAQACGMKLPHTLPYLLALRTAATIEKTDPGAAEAVLASLVRKPASDAWLRGRKRRVLHARRKARALQSPAEVPVPPEPGDRHLASDEHSAVIADYVRHVAAGRFRHAQFIAWGVGTSLDPVEFPALVASLRLAGAEDAIEAVLNAAAGRDDTRASINIAMRLLDEGQVAEAQTMLAAIRPRE